MSRLSEFGGKTLAEIQEELLADRARLMKDLNMDGSLGVSRKRPASASAAKSRKSIHGAYENRDGRRSSSRIKGKKGDSEEDASSESSDESSSSSEEEEEEEEKKVENKTIFPIPKAIMPSPPPPSSSRGLPSRINWLYERLLGRFVPMRLGGAGAQAKRAVMCAVHAGAGVPAFNKYAGVAEFADAVVLFVNLFSATGGAGTRNHFLNKGRSINWFGGDKAHENTPSLLRLRYHATGFHIDPVTGEPVPGRPPSKPSRGGAAAASGGPAPQFSPPCPVVMVIRLAAGLPYVYVGELEFEEFRNPGKQPVEYVWRLKNCAELAEEALKAARAAARPLSAAARLPTLEEAMLEDSREGQTLGDSVGIRTGSPRWLAVLKAGGLEPTASLLEDCQGLGSNDEGVSGEEEVITSSSEQK